MGDKVTRISHGDHHYEIRHYDSDGFAYHEDMKIVYHMYKALNSFHDSAYKQSKSIAELRMKLYELAGDRPDLIHELTDRGLI
jgi:hypothetical protein